MKRISTILKSIPKIKNMTSSNGNNVSNQFIIRTNEGTFFQSYNTIIAANIKGKTYLDEGSWDYSVELLINLVVKTTGKYRNQFLGMDKRETEKLIKSGSIKLVNLNN